MRKKPFVVSAGALFALLLVLLVGIGNVWGNRTFSISSQYPGNYARNFNVAHFFAAKSGTTGDNPVFTGYWELKPGENSINANFGNYGMGTGMLDDGTGEYGNGACNSASFLIQVAADFGLPWNQTINGQPTQPTHDYVPGVDREKAIAVFTQQGSYWDGVITNPNSYPLYMNWSRNNDQITIWISEEPGSVSAQPMSSHGAANVSNSSSKSKQSDLLEQLLSGTSAREEPVENTSDNSASLQQLALGLLAPQKGAEYVPNSIQTENQIEIKSIITIVSVLGVIALITVVLTRKPRI